MSKIFEVAEHGGVAEHPVRHSSSLVYLRVVVDRMQYLRRQIDTASSNWNAVSLCHPRLKFLSEVDKDKVRIV